jgi:predicted ester cyclase
MSEELKAKMCRLVDEAWNKGNLDVLSELLAVNYVRHQPPYPDVVGLEALKKFIADVRVSYPDFRIDGEEVIAEGSTTVMRCTWGGTQTGTSPATGAPGTGKKVKVANCTVVHWVNGQGVEEWALSDWLSFLQQLGYTLIPPEPQK